jgi:ATP-dependent Lhr-like helicase
VRELLVAESGYVAPGPVHAAVLERLGRHGASFMIEIDDHVRAGGHAVSSREIRDAMWDLVWAGQITNDTFAPLRELAAAARRQGGRAQPGAVTVAGGRWSLVANLAPAAPDATRQAVARAGLLLDRYGIVSRQCALAENLPGGFGPVYKVCRELEEQGRVRRGHFVDGLPGAQFAWPGAADRLRASRTAAEERDRPVSAADIAVLAATDPANPYGALLPWPPVSESARARLRRVEGSWVVLARGRPVLYVGARGSQLVTFPETVRDEEGALEAAIDALRRLPKGATRRLLVIETIDGENVSESPHLSAFRQSGFANDYRGLVDTRPPGEPPGGWTH